MECTMLRYWVELERTEEYSTDRHRLASSVSQIDPPRDLNQFEWMAERADGRLLLLRLSSGVQTCCF